MNINQQREEMKEVINKWIEKNQAEADININVLQKEANAIDSWKKSDLIKSTGRLDYINVFLKDLFHYTKINHEPMPYKTCIHELGHAYINYFFEMPENYCNIIQVNKDGSGFVDWIKKVNPVLAIFSLLAGTVAENLIFDTDKEITKGDYWNIISLIEDMYFVSGENICLQKRIFFKAIVETVLKGGIEIIKQVAEILKSREQMSYAEVCQLFKRYGESKYNFSNKTS